MISVGTIGSTVKPNNIKPKDIEGKYQIKLVDPKIIGDEMIKLRIAFLESVKNIKPTRTFKEEDEDDGKTSSALGSLGLKPKPAI